MSVRTAIGDAVLDDAHELGEGMLSVGTSSKDSDEIRPVTGAFAASV
jgi:hypothetical protein